MISVSSVQSTAFQLLLKPALSLFLLKILPHPPMLPLLFASYKISFIFTKGVRTNTFSKYTKLLRHLVLLFFLTVFRFFFFSLPMFITFCNYVSIKCHFPITLCITWESGPCLFGSLLNTQHLALCLEQSKH